ncbi:unnamed protein product [Cuscuta campestris]|uniref:Uncharacterized protein n=1 Tax=Cuscuta campestris TaxID=132261 RepID=A0A484M6D6_9ASTE|nr:unnamed protein product [Cuscuta campestris]
MRKMLRLTLFSCNNSTLPLPNQVTHFNFHCSTTEPSLPDDMPEQWARRVQEKIDTSLAAQRISFQEMMDKSEEKHSSSLQELRSSYDKNLKIITHMNSLISNLLLTYAYDSHLQHKDIVENNEQLATVTKSLQKQMGLVQIDIRSALALSSANQCVA